MRLAAGLCLDPLGKLERSPRLRSRRRGPTSTGKGRKGRGREEEKGEEKVRGDCLLFIDLLATGLGS